MLALFVNAALALTVLLISGCKDQGPTDPAVSDIVFPASNVSYSQHVDPLFTQRCAFGGCHYGPSPAGALDLTRPSYEGLRNHFPALVIAGEPNNSILVQKIEGTLQPRMPYNRPPLTDNQMTSLPTNL